MRKSHEERDQSGGSCAGAAIVQDNHIPRTFRKGRIGKETQDRIARFLEEQNAVVKTRSGMEKSKNIAILFPSHAIVAETPFFQNCLDGVYAYCSQKGYDLFYVSEKNDDLSKLKQLLDRKKVDGFILTHYQLGNNLIQSCR